MNKLRIDWKKAHCTEKAELLELLHKQAERVNVDLVASAHTLVIEGAQHGQFFGDDFDAESTYCRYLNRIEL